jgi:hypothetical protein
MRCDDSQVYFGECDREGLPRLSVQWIGQTELKEEESIMCNSRCIELKITWDISGAKMGEIRVQE